jgi:non-heme Fe2+,alpha-ketoglutarate-dependent halogenase
VTVDHIEEAVEPRTDPLLDERECQVWSREGWVGPFPLLRPGEARAVIQSGADVLRAAPWYKGLHAFDTIIADIARRPEIVERVQDVLGDDLILWGSQIMPKPPGVPHRWHVDVETLAWTSVNVWIALENVSLDATIGLIPGSHRWSSVPQEWEDDGIDLGDTGAVGRVAAELHPGSEIEWVDMVDGEFVMFDGHLWHGSENRTRLRRSALLLQYSPSDVTARIPVTYREPVEWRDDQPPCLLISGGAGGGGNLIVEPSPPPKPAALTRVVDRLRGRR